MSTKLPDRIHVFQWTNPSVNNCNTFFIHGDKKILVDPGHYHLFAHVEDQLRGVSVSLKEVDLVIITHGHPDHMEAVKAFQGTNAMIAVSSVEMGFIRKVAPHYGQALGIPDFEPQLLLQEGELHMGGLTFQVILSPGHSPGSICLYWPEERTLFTGDVVFSQGLGRTDLPGGDGTALKQSIRNLSLLEVEHLLPGHGEIVSGLDAVKRNFQGIEDFWFPYI